MIAKGKAEGRAGGRAEQSIGPQKQNCEAWKYKHGEPACLDPAPEAKRATKNPHTEGIAAKGPSPLIATARRRPTGAAGPASARGIVGAAH